MSIINLKELHHGTNVEGFVLIQSHGTKTDTTNAPLKGVLHYKGKNVNFNVWQSGSPTLVQFFNTNDASGKIAFMRGRVKVDAKYGEQIDMMEINFNIPPDLTVGHFIKSVDVNAVANELWTFLGKHLTPEHFVFVNEFFKANEQWNAFITTWAGQSMHDAQIGGLANHTLKMLRLSEVLVQNDQRLEPYKSILFLSILLHDLGKVQELNDRGVYQPESFVSHRLIGIEMLAEHKQLALKHMSLHDYRIIVSVMHGHHGNEFGDKPTSIWALIIHHIDALEAATTSFLDSVENNKVEVHLGNNKIWYGEKIAF